MKSQLILHTITALDQFENDFKGSVFRGRPEPRIALVGRSNVGKSSLANALLGAQVAKVSSSPGKTKALHFYDWKKIKSILVDLPGYGFAAESKESRDFWQELISAYLEVDIHLSELLILIDSRHGFLEKDLEALRYFAGKGIQFRLIYTKWDQVKTQSDRAKAEKRDREQQIEFKDHLKSFHRVSVEDSRTIQALEKALAAAV